MDKLRLVRHRLIPQNSKSLSFLTSKKGIFKIQTVTPFLVWFGVITNGKLIIQPANTNSLPIQTGRFIYKHMIYNIAILASTIIFFRYGYTIFYSIIPLYIYIYIYNL